MHTSNVWHLQCISTALVLNFLAPCLCISPKLWHSFFAMLDTPPNCFTGTDFVQLQQHLLMRSTLCIARVEHLQHDMAQIHRSHTQARFTGVIVVGDEQGLLTAREVDVHVGQQFSVQQSPVQGTTGVVHA